MAVKPKSKPKKTSALAKLKAENAELKAQLEDANERLATNRRINDELRAKLK
jgi:hypothetical protein